MIEQEQDEDPTSSTWGCLLYRGRDLQARGLSLNSISCCLCQTNDAPGQGSLSQLSVFMWCKAALGIVEERNKSVFRTCAKGKDFAGRPRLAQSKLLCSRAAQRWQVDLLSIWKAGGKGQMSGWCQVFYTFGNIQVLYWITTLIGWVLIASNIWKEMPFY